MSRTIAEDHTPGPEAPVEGPPDSYTRPPKLPVGVLYRRYHHAEEGGEPLTEAEKQAWRAYTQELEEYEHRRDTLGLVDLANVMENGPTEPEMLTESLVRSEHHVVFGARESAKTWLVLADAVELIGRDESVIWVDKEMGRRNIAGRLTTLGATPEQVRGQFVYMEHPSMDCGRDSKAAWRALLEEREPALVVVDAQTEVLADAGLNENSGTDVEKWSQAYVTPARRIGAATVMIDHTGHSETGRPVASRQKGAAAKVELSVTRDARFSKDTVGRVTVEVTKNTVSAPMPDRRSWRIGGEDGKFVLEPSGPRADPKAAARAEREARVERDVVAKLGEAEQPLTQNQVAELVKGAKAEVVAVVRRLANDEASPVRAKASGRSILYSLATE